MANVNKKLCRATRKMVHEEKPLLRTHNQQDAIAKKKRVVLTEHNPNTNETNKRMVRRVVLAQAFKSPRSSQSPSQAQ